VRTAMKRATVAVMTVTRPRDSNLSIRADDPRLVRTAARASASPGGRW
jgi:hypothetical protein